MATSRVRLAAPLTLIWHLLTVDLSLNRPEALSQILFKGVETKVRTTRRDTQSVNLSAKHLGERGQPLVHLVVLRVQAVSSGKRTAHTAERSSGELVPSDLARTPRRALELREQRVYALAKDL
ncbi:MULTISPECIES: hypothetical protein [Streptomyces]